MDDPITIDVLDTIGALHDGVCYVLSIGIAGRRYDAAIWVHKDADSVLVLEYDLEVLLDAPDGSNNHRMVVKRIEREFDKAQLLQHPDELQELNTTQL